MRLRSFFLFLLASSSACGPADDLSVGEATESVVYGFDDRLEVYAHPNRELQRIARESVVALIPSSRLVRQPGGSYALAAFSLKDERGLCADERFASQPVAASCSGVLIDDDLVLTAGHCISASRPCTTFSYVFDYFYEGPGTLAEISDEDVYTCGRVVLDLDSSVQSLTPDFAIIQLDRPVEGDRAPARVRAASALSLGERVAMIGFGSGLPAKIDAGASVAVPRNEQLDYFVVNLDAFEGHSGSATFDARNELTGILIGGRVPDYEPADGEDCSRVNVFDDVEAGEVVHNVAPIIAALCDTGEATDHLCAEDACGGAPCGQVSPSGPYEPAGPGPGVAGGQSSGGCSASPGTPNHGAFWAGALLIWAVSRLRRTSV